MKKITFYCFFLASLSLWSQDSNRVFYGLQLEYGSMILHSQDLFPVGPSNPYGTGLDYGKWLLKEKHWDNCKCFPRLGLSLNYVNFDKPGIWGWGLPFYGFLEPHFRLYPRWHISLRAGVGFAWLSDPFHAVDNPANLSYSLAVTPLATLGSGISYALSEQWLMQFQLRYNHASNGGFREPNKGLNYPTFALGMSYTPQEMDFPDYSGREKNQRREENWSIRHYIAGKAIDASRVTYVVHGLEGIYSHDISRLNALEGGLEITANYAFRELIRQKGSDQHHYQSAVLLGHRFLLGNFHFSQQAGIYILRDYKVSPAWYQRYTLMWNFWRNFLVGTSLKAHGHVAEIMDFRLGLEL